LPEPKPTGQAQPGLQSWLRLLALFSALITAPVSGHAGTCDTSVKAEAPVMTAASAALERGNLLAADERHAEALAAFEESERAALAEKNAALAALGAASAARSAALLGAGAEPRSERLETVLLETANLDDAALRAQLRLHIGRTLDIGLAIHRTKILRPRSIGMPC
jgi:hypothetical protein